jgi:hypothetical protein
MMSKPRKSLMNLSLDYDLLEAIKERAKAGGCEKVSDFIQDWLKKLAFERTDIKRAVLQIPEGALKDRMLLEAWLVNRSAEIVDHYFKE